MAYTRFGYREQGPPCYTTVGQYRIPTEDNLTLHKYAIPLTKQTKAYRVFVVRDIASWSHCLRAVQQNAWSMIGVDAEWPPPALCGLDNPPITLMQFASDSVVILVSLVEWVDRSQKPWSFQTSVPLLGAVAALLEAPFLKIGCALHSDLWKLNQLLVQHKLPKLSSVPQFELQQMADAFRLRSSLKHLASHFLTYTLTKCPNVRCSDWSAWPLTMQQQRYAALDAIVSRDIYCEFQRRYYVRPQHISEPANVAYEYDLVFSGVVDGFVQAQNMACELTNDLLHLARPDNVTDDDHQTQEHVSSPTAALSSNLMLNDDWNVVGAQKEEEKPPLSTSLISPAITDSITDLTVEPSYADIVRKHCSV